MVLQSPHCAHAQPLATGLGAAGGWVSLGSVLSEHAALPLRRPPQGLGKTSRAPHKEHQGQLLWYCQLSPCGAARALCPTAEASLRSGLSPLPCGVTFPSRQPEPQPSMLSPQESKWPLVLVSAEHHLQAPVTDT